MCALVGVPIKWLCEVHGATIKTLKKTFWSQRKNWIKKKAFPSGNHNKTRIRKNVMFKLADSVQFRKSCINTSSPLAEKHRVIDSSWNVMAHGDAREGKWRGNWRLEWVASTLHTASEHGVSSITTADAHTSAASSRLNWRRPSI